MRGNAGVTEMNFGLLVETVFFVLGFWPLYRPCGGIFFVDGFILNAKRIYDNPEFSFRTIVFLSLLEVARLLYNMVFLFFHYPCDLLSDIPHA